MSVTEELENAIPASVAASMTPSRRCRSCGEMHTARRCSPILLSALRQMGSVIAFAFRETYASIAWQSASMPVSAVSRRGMLIVSS
eukprot:scaffold87467_cov33-Tisochrysis_lutea.AAC.2